MFLSALSSGKWSGIGTSIMSISPWIRALTAVIGSEMASHSTRSTLATLPPASLVAWSKDALTQQAIEQFERDTDLSLR